MLHRLAIAQALPDAVDNSFGDRQQILQFSRELTPEDVQLFYQTALMGRRDLHLSPDPRAGFEMTLLRMLAFKPQGLADLPQAPLHFAGQIPTPAAEPAHSEPLPMPSASVAPALATPIPVANVPDTHAIAAPGDAMDYDASEPPMPPDENYEPMADAQTRVDNQVFASDEAHRHAPAQPVAQQPNASLEAGTAAKKSLAPAPSAKLSSVLSAELSAELGLSRAADLIHERKTRDKPAAPAEAPVVPVSAVGISLDELRPEHWVSVYQALNIRGVIQSTASNAILTGREGNQLYFLLDESRASLFEDSHRQRLADLLSDYFAQPIKVHINIGALAADHLTPAQAGINDRAEKLEQGIATLRADPFVQQLISEFDGVLKIDTVKVL